MPKLVALANFRTREVLKPGDPNVTGPAQFSVTRTNSSLPSTDPKKPTVIEVSDAEAESLIAAGLARTEEDHEEKRRLAEEAAERGPIPQVNVESSAAPRGPASGLTMAPDPNVVGERAKLDKRIYEGTGDDASRVPLEVRHSAPIDRTTSSPQSLAENEGEGEERRRRGRPPRT